MFANQLTRILSYTKDLDIIKEINNKIEKKEKNV